MAVTARIPIWTTSGGNLQPVTTGSYDIRVSPFSSPGIAGSHIGNGIWMFESVDDTAEYKVYDTAGGTEMTGITGGGAHTLAFFDTSLQAYLKLTGGTMSGNIAMGGNKLTGLGAGSGNGDSVRWEQVGVLAEDRNITGRWIFNMNSDGKIPRVNAPSSNGLPVSNGDLTSKYYVDTLFAGVIGVVQSTYMVKLLPSRTAEDTYSKQTAEKCYTYLSALTDIATRFGAILVEPLAQAGNLINLDDGTTQWIGNGVFYHGIGNKPTLNRRAPNSSLTVTNAGLINCHILDNNVVSARAYTGFTFENCTMDIPDLTDVSFTNCKFKGVNKFKSDGGGELTMSNCTGDIFIYNDSIGTVTLSGTQPAQVLSTAATNFDY